MRRISWSYIPTRKQALAHASPAKVLLFGGAMGGGKSVWLCTEMMQRMLEVPGNRVAIVRRTLTSLRKTTFETFQAKMPAEAVRGINQQTMTVTFRNGSECLFLAADVTKDPLLEELKSLEVSTMGLEEATQMTRLALSVAAQRTRWVTRSGVHPRRGILLTCNPELGWVKETFYDPWVAGRLPRGWDFIPSLPGDNPHLPAEYLETMDQILTAEDRQRYVLGMWTAPLDPARLISFESVRRSLDGDWLTPGEVAEEWLSQDVAYEGDDFSTLWLVRFAADGRWDARRLAKLAGNDEVQVAEEAERQWVALGTRPRLVVDATGIGSGVATILAHKGIRVQRFKGGERPVYDGLKISYRNLRDQAWWWTRIHFAAGLGTMEEDARAVEDLTSPRYKVGSDRRIEVERKVEIKKRLGRSPDDGDAITMAIMAHKMRTAGRATGRAVGAGAGRR